MIPQTVIEEILNIETAEIIGRYITLKRKGTNYQACCPFHQEKTPSFSVSSVKGIYKCFGCGKSGNAISFVMEYKKVDFPQACIDIASQQNIIIPKEERTDEEKKEGGKRQALFTVSKMACEWFQKNLNDPENKKAREYVLGRWSEEIVREFAVGFAPDGGGN